MFAGKGDDNQSDTSNEALGAPGGRASNAYEELPIEIRSLTERYG